MAVFDFTVPIYGFDQWSAAASTNNTVSYPVGTTFTLDANPTLTVIDVQDDDGNPVGSSDNLFDDGYIDTPGDGSTPSTANNDQVLTQAVTINGQNFQVGDQVELEFAFETTSGETFWVIRIDGTNVGISGPTLPQPGTTYEVASSSDGQFTPISDVPCFTCGAMVETPSGDVAIENIKAGDIVTTLDHGPQAVLWAGMRRISKFDMSFFPLMRPILVKQGSLGLNRPNADLVVSPNHRLVVSSPQTDLYFGEGEVLVSAKALVNDQTIYPVRESSDVIYRHLLFERHEVLLVNGLPTESLYPGNGITAPQVLLDNDLAKLDFDTRPGLARPELRHFEASLLVA